MSHPLPANAPLVSAVSLTKIYSRGREKVRALDDVSFEIQRGEFFAIVGPSGSGKTTLLNLLGCMDTPSHGMLTITGKPVEQLPEKERTRLRREQIGFVFQNFGLIPTLTVAENIGLPTLFARRRNARETGQLLERVGLSHRREHRPHQLSGGEMQRVAIARALVNEPQLLLADEPTGNLDSTTGDAIINLFQQLHASGLTVVVVTHNAALADAAKRRITLRDGRIVTADH